MPARKRRNVFRRKRRRARRGGGFALFSILIILLVGAVLAYWQRDEILTRLGFGTARFEWLNEQHIAVGELTVTFIDVGQGDAAFIRHSEGTTMLIDAGDHRRNSGQRIYSYLQSIGVTHIDYIVGTHPHADHIGGIEHLLRNISVGRIFMPYIQHNTQTFLNLLIAIDELEHRVETPAPGDRLNIGGAEATFIHPRVPQDASLNDHSLMLIVRFGEHSFIFTGDAEHPAEGMLVDKGINISATVLDVGHHGSTTSTGEAFLAAVNPQIAVIQVGANSFGHPHPSVLNRLLANVEQVYRTDLYGTIVFTTDGEELRVTTER